MSSLDKGSFTRDSAVAVGSAKTLKLLKRDTRADEKIGILKNGPYVVAGGVELKDAEGNVYPAKDKIALCRCGASRTNPFCDGPHSKIGFQAAERAVPGSAEK